MTTEWKELKTLQEVAAAQAAGEEIEYTYASKWMPWHGEDWQETTLYHSRPKKRTKTVVLREALVLGPLGHYFTRWCSHCDDGLVRWLDTPVRVVKVEE